MLAVQVEPAGLAAGRGGWCRLDGALGLQSQSACLPLAVTPKIHWHLPGATECGLGSG